MARAADFPRTVAGISRALRTMPVTVAHAVSRVAAPELTRLLRGAFDGKRTVYGDARPGDVTLVKTGATRRTLAFVSNGTQVRCALGTKYARYLIGKYRILPSGNQAIPVAWSQALDRTTAVEADRAMRQGVST